MITITDIHLSRRIGEAVRHAYHGKLELHYGKDEYSMARMNTASIQSGDGNA